MRSKLISFHLATHLSRTCLKLNETKSTAAETFQIGTQLLRSLSPDKGSNMGWGGGHYVRTCQISVPHIILFVTHWLQVVLGVKYLNRRGIGKKEISKQSEAVRNIFQDGHREARLQFNAKQQSKTMKVVIVVVTLASILAVQKHPVNSSIANTICENMVKVGIQSQENEISPESASLFEESFAPLVDVDDNARCFVLPFRSSNHSLLSADARSSDLSSRLTKLVGNGDVSSLSGYFENSLKDTIKKNSV
eukprot:scaffold38621_cov311-Skeletonema_dohrnii-CCMP3373.AAC.1